MLTKIIRFVETSGVSPTLQEVEDIEATSDIRPNPAELQPRVFRGAQLHLEVRPANAIVPVETRHHWAGAWHSWQNGKMGFREQIMKSNAIQSLKSWIVSETK